MEKSDTKTELKASLLRYKRCRKRTHNMPSPQRNDILLPLIYNMLESMTYIDPDTQNDPNDLAAARQLLADWNIKEQLVPWETFVKEIAITNKEVVESSLLVARVCRRCGRGLSNWQSLIRGVGPICVGKRGGGGR